jgi:hypothetical protein
MTAPRTEAGLALLAETHASKGPCYDSPACDCGQAIATLDTERARYAALVEAATGDHRRSAGAYPREAPPSRRPQGDGAVTPTRRLVTIAAGALYVVSGVWLWEAVQVIGFPAVRALMAHYGIGL